MGYLIPKQKKTTFATSAALNEADIYQFFDDNDNSLTCSRKTYIIFFSKLLCYETPPCVYNNKLQRWEQNVIMIYSIIRSRVTYSIYIYTTY